MKRVIVILLILCLTASFCKQKEQIQVQAEQHKNLYLGQVPPGLTPQVFASGIISKTGKHLHSCIVFSPSGDEIYFTVRTYEPVTKNTIFYIKMEDQIWSDPQTASFSGVYSDDSPTFSIDGDRLYFNSSRPIDSLDTSQDLNFWYVNRTNSGWSEPIYAGNILNSDSCDFRLSITNSNTIFFSSDRDIEDKKGFNIFVTKYKNGTYSTPKILSAKINTDVTEQIAFIAPDESYIIFYRYQSDRTENTGLYISFKRPDGSWTIAKNMGETINAPTDLVTQAASISPDGKYLFFLRRYAESIYWVNAKIIEELRPIGFK